MEIERQEIYIRSIIKNNFKQQQKKIKYSNYILEYISQISLEMKKKNICCKDMATIPVLLCSFLLEDYNNTYGVKNLSSNF